MCSSDLSGSLPLTPQPTEGVTYARKIEKSETRIDWNAPAREVHDRIRGLSPFPGAWCEAHVGGNVERLKLLRSVPGSGSDTPGTLIDNQLTVACGEGAVRLVEVQRAGGKPVTGQEFLRGAKLEEGMRLT